MSDMISVGRVGIDLSFFLDEVPGIGLMEPAVHGWKMIPPSYGWAIPIKMDGRSVIFDGSPAQIVGSIQMAMGSIGQKIDEQRIWDYCNLIWCHRAGEKSLFLRKGQPNPSLSERAIRRAMRTPRETFRDFAKSSLSLLSHNGFTEKFWDDFQIDLATRFNPASRRPTSSYDTHLAVTAWKTLNPPDRVETIQQAEKWIEEMIPYVIDFKRPSVKMGHITAS